MFIGEKIRNLRIERKLSLRKLAYLSGISSFSYIANIERGVVDDPGIKTIIKIAKGLNISIDDLVRNVDI
ncbi:MAG: helix-turn-helix transcriptional regulator [Tissierella sp.]|nr:helix-turn-helix transcriptional regulator [Tissierella sp.]